MSNETNISVLATSIASVLEETGEALLKEKGNRPLRNIQKFIWSWKEETSGNEKEFIFFSLFFLDMFIDKVLYNLSGDVPSVERVTEETQVSFYEHLGIIFQSIGRNLRYPNENELYLCYAKLARLYMDTVNALNRSL